MATVTAVEQNFYTQPDVRTAIDVLLAQEKRAVGVTRATFGDVRVDDVVVGGEFNGFLLASGAAAPGIPEVAREILSFECRNVVQRSAVPAGWAGRTFAELSQHFLASGRGDLAQLGD